MGDDVTNSDPWWKNITNITTVSGENATITIKNKEKNNMANTIFGTPVTFSATLTMEASIPKIERVIFNPPATIVVWKDGTKTVSKVRETEDGLVEDYDPEKGLAMAVSKKYFELSYDYKRKVVGKSNFTMWFESLVKKFKKE